MRKAFSTIPWILIVIFSSCLLFGCDGGDEDAKSSKTDELRKELEQAVKETQAQAEKAIAEAKKKAIPTIKATVTINEKKTNGKSWDTLKGKPDIALCYTTGDNKICIPGGKDSVESGKDAHCQNAFTCTFEVAEDAVNFEVYDVDMASNDSIGTGSCSPGNTCKFESCSIQLSGAPGKAAAPAAPKAAAPVAPKAAAPVAPKAAAPAAPKAEFSVGSRVSCDWKSRGTFYNGTIAKKKGNKIFVKYDDGDKEKTVVSKCRPLGAPAAAKSTPAGATAKAAAAAPAVAKKEKKKKKKKKPEIKYPAPCKGLNMKKHVAIKKDEKWCVPSLAPMVIMAGGENMPNMPSYYDDNNEITLLTKPNKTAEEESSLTNSERNKLAKEVKKKIFYKSLGSYACDTSFVDANGKLSADCDISGVSLYHGKAPTVKKTQECEMVDGCTVEECSRHRDCETLFCGCPRSRCTVFGTCTRCPATKECDDPEYELKTNNWKLNGKFKKKAKKKAKMVHEKRSEHQFFMAYKLSSLFRKVSTAKECEEDYDGKKVCETVIADDTGYYGKITPVYAGFLKCKDNDCKVGNTRIAADLLNTSFSMTLANKGHKATVSCKNGTCTARKAK